MKVTFIVGNGLDISLGMETSYPEFYKYIKDKKKDTKNPIYIAIQNDHEDWSDFEVALGRHTEGIELLSSKKARDIFVEEFFESYNEVLEDLADYLGFKQAELKEKAVSYIMRREHIYSELKDGAARKITTVLGNQPIELGLVTLNYTNSLEQLLYQNANYMKNRGMILKSVHHAHGSLAEYLTIGVNDESQLSAALSDESKDNLIKSKLLSSMDDDRLGTTENIIASSSIIVIYGTSLGETDAYIWQKVVSWLRTKTNGYVIVHDFSRDPLNSHPRNPIRIKQLDNEARDRLLSHSSELSGEELVELRSRILIIRNTDKLFNLTD